MMLEAVGSDGKESCAMGKEKEGEKVWKSNFIHFIIFLDAGPILVSRSGDGTS